MRIGTNGSTHGSLTDVGLSAEVQKLRGRQEIEKTRKSGQKQHKRKMSVVRA